MHSDVRIMQLDTISQNLTKVLKMTSETRPLLTVSRSTRTWWRWPHATFREPCPSSSSALLPRRHVLSLSHPVLVRARSMVASGELDLNGQSFFSAYLINGPSVFLESVFPLNH